MAKRVLITGGAGFIGSHLTDELIQNGYKVRILDNLNDQVHGSGKKRPEYLNSNAELVNGDILNHSEIENSLKDVDIVYHFAARVGVGQSMYEIDKYSDTNIMGTSHLLQYLIDHPVEKLIVASSMSIYGEGLYKNIKGEIVNGTYRSLAQLKQGKWELIDNENQILVPVPTNESKVPVLASIYALSKYNQEQMCLITGNAYKIPVVALRFFNVYGTRQALSNPYTGVLAIFASRLLNGNPPLIFEDGNQKRDFIHVRDVARACRLAAERNEANYNVINIGSGNAYSINELAEELSKVMKIDTPAKVTGKYRVGDIRHCFADITRMKEMLGYTPQVQLNNGLSELAEWVSGQIASDNVEYAHSELFARGLSV